MNLLPLEDQKNTAVERFTRFAIVAGLGTLGVLLVALAFLAPSYLYFTLQSRELLRGLEIERKSPELLKVQSIESSIRNLNSRVVAMTDNAKALRDPSVYINATLRLKPVGISLNKLIYERSKAEAGALTVSGHAATREKLLAFVGKLEASGEFAKVYSPISNLLVRDEVEFSLVLDLKKP